VDHPKKPRGKKTGGGKRGGRGEEDSERVVLSLDRSSVRRRQERERKLKKEKEKGWKRGGEGR